MRKAVITIPIMVGGVMHTIKANQASVGVANVGSNSHYPKGALIEVYEIVDKPERLRNNADDKEQLRQVQHSQPH